MLRGKMERIRRLAARKIPCSIGDGFFEGLSEEALSDASGEPLNRTGIF